MNRVWLIVSGDFISFLGAFIILVFIRFNTGEYLSAIYLHAVPFIILYIFWVLIFYVFGLYDLINIKPTIPYLKRWILALITSFIIGLLLFYFVSIFGISPKINLIIQVALFGLFSFLFRRIIYTLFSKTITRPAIIIGNSVYITELSNTISNSPQIGLYIIKRLNSINEINLNMSPIKNLVIILDKKNDALEEEIINLYKNKIEIIDITIAYEKYLSKIPLSYINMSFIANTVIIKKDMLYSFATFLINKIFSIIIITLTLPVLLLSAIFIYLNDKGPIIYKQDRVGINGQIFKLYKLRSMIVNSEKDGATWSSGINDARVTPIGKIIRKLHIDEIPQMINILKGDISFVGPRPERPEFVSRLEKTIPQYKLRHIIHPGFTGWAQIRYRYASSVEDSKEKFEYDLYYIKNRNIFLDFGIILKTIQIIFTH